MDFAWLPKVVGAKVLAKSVVTMYTDTVSRVCRGAQCFLMSYRLPAQYCTYQCYKLAFVSFT